MWGWGYIKDKFTACLMQCSLIPNPFRHTHTKSQKVELQTLQREAQDTSGLYQSKSLKGAWELAKSQ